MATNLQVLQKAIGEFTDCPFFLLPKANQQKILDKLRKVFSGIRHRLEQRYLEKTTVSQQVKKTQSFLEQEEFNEYRFAQNLLSFFKGQPGFESFVEILKALAKRNKAFWVAEEAAVKARVKLTEQQIFDHDYKLLAEEMQLFALDYFLLFYKLLKTAKGIEKSFVIFNGQEGMPSLIEDALEESMLNKLVYTLYSYDLRKEMFKDYYDYKQAFLRLQKDQTPAEQQAQNIETSLREYLLKLVRLSLRYKIGILENGVHFPFKKGTSFVQLEKELSI